MSLNKRIGRNEGAEKLKIWQVALYSVFFLALIFICSILQTTCLSAFGKTPALTLALVCAIGFIAGEKMGAVFGIAGGIIVDILGSTGFSFSPVIYMLCGYFCGALVGWFLSQNFPSFIVYGAIAGVLRELFTFAYYVLLSREFSLLDVLAKVIVPEYLAYLICILPAYFAVLAIFSLFKGKDKRVKKRR